jgi:hypothetical protein
VQDTIGKGLTDDTQHTDLWKIITGERIAMQANEWMLNGKVGFIRP